MMRVVRSVPLAAACAVLLTACPSTTPTGSSTPTTSGSQAGGVAPHLEHDACPYRNDILVSTPQAEGLLGLKEVERFEPPGRSTAAGEASTDAAANDTATKDTTATGTATGDTVAGAQGADNQATDALLAAPTVVYQLPEGQSAQETITQLGGQGIQAGPVLMLTPARHWIFGAGTDPVDTDDALTVPGTGRSAENVVAELDTGLTMTSATDSWISDNVVNAEPEPSGAVPEGHGKFVASVILQQNPAVSVSAGAVEAQALTSFQNGSGLAGATTMTDELALLHAVQRLVKTKDLQNMKVLNLSVGSFVCDAAQAQAKGWLIALALETWYRATGGRPVVAAAGNHDPDDATYDPNVVEFIPGQWGTGAAADIPGIGKRPLYGVQSVDASGQRSAFSNAGTFSAPGENLCGVRLDGKTTIWSGSSFAAAVVSASIAAGQVPVAGTPVAASPTLASAPDGATCKAGS